MRCIVAAGLLYRTLMPVATVLALASCNDATPTQPDRTPDRPAAAPEFVLAPNSWVPRAALPNGRHGIGLGVARNAAGRDIVYAIGGYDAKPPFGTQVSTSLTAYDYTTNSWSRKATLPLRLGQPNGVGLIGGKLYVSGGVREIGHDQVLQLPYLFAYDPLANTWSRKADMPRGTSWGVTGVINGRLYVLSLGRLYRYTPSTNRWATLARCPHDHWAGAGGAIKGKLYVAGGYTAGTDGTELDAYDPATNRWTARAPMPTGRTYMAAAVLRNQLYVIGGAGAQALATVEAYDPLTDRWSTKAPMPTAREDLGVASFVTPSGNPKILAVGGLDWLTTNELYTP